MMKHKLIRNSVFTASTVLLISGLIKLLPSHNPQLFLIAGTLGLTGTTLVKKEEKQDPTKKIKQESVLIEQKLSILEQQLKQANDNSNFIQQNLIDLFDREIQNAIKEANSKILVLEQDIKEILDRSDLDRHEILDIINQETKAELQQADDKILALEQRIKEIPSSAEQELIDLVDRELQRSNFEIGDRVIALEQKIKELIKESINQANKKNQSARDRIKAHLENQIAQSQLQTNSKENTTTSLGIIELLKLQSVEIEANPVKYDSQQNQLANEIAKNYDCLQDFYRQFIKKVKNNQAFEYCLKDKHNEDIVVHTSLGAELKKLGFYPGYKYQGKNAKIMSFPVCPEQVTKKLFKFLQGGWFEVHILAQTIKYLTRKNAKNKNKKRELIKYSFLLNPYANFYKKNDSKLYRKYELDILLLIESHLVWIECKSGKVSDAELQKYSDNNQRFLKIPKRNALVVCFKISDSDAALKTKQYPGITVINPNSLVKSLEIILNSKPILLPATSTVGIADIQPKDNTLTTIDVQPSIPISRDALEVSASTVNKPQIVKQSLTV